MPSFSHPYLIVPASPQTRMSEQQCPLCRSDSYLNPNIRILVSPCFHRLCEQCVYKLFAHGHAPCPTCQTPLRRINFIASSFEDLGVEREVRIRRLLNAAFARKPDEFGTMQEYNDYLEAFEDTVSELLEAESETSVKGRIAQIKAEDSILNPAARSKKHRIAAPAQTTRKRPRADVSREPGPARPRITRAVSIPAAVMTPCDASGLTRSDILDRIISSLFGC